MSEAGFLAMDLAAHGSADLAYDFLTAYLEAGGDYDGLDVLRFYAVHLALVRAKVRALKARAEVGGGRPGRDRSVPRDRARLRRAAQTAALDHSRALGQRQDARDASVDRRPCAPSAPARTSSASGCTASKPGLTRVLRVGGGLYDARRDGAHLYAARRGRAPRRCATASTRSSTRRSCAARNATRSRGSRRGTEHDSRSSIASRRRTCCGDRISGACGRGSRRVRSGARSARPSARRARPARRGRRSHCRPRFDRRPDRLCERCRWPSSRGASLRAASVAGPHAPAAASPPPLGFGLAGLENATSGQSCSRISVKRADVPTRSP